MTDKERINILTSAVNNMAQFLRNNPPSMIPEEMDIQAFCHCFVDGQSDPTGERIKEFFVMKAYEEYGG